MKRKTLSISMILILIAGIFVLSGCTSKKEENENPDKVRIEKKLSSLNSDVIVSKNYPGGECTESYEYHICYDSLKLYEYKTCTVYPFTSSENKKKTEPEYTLKEFDITKEQMEKIKQATDKENLTETQKSGNDNFYYVKLNGKEYKMNDSKVFYTTLKEITK